jgi:uncharacterized RDD family membrane protein YckC
LVFWKLVFNLILIFNLKPQNNPMESLDPFSNNTKLADPAKRAIAFVIDMVLLWILQNFIIVPILMAVGVISALPDMPLNSGEMSEGQAMAMVSKLMGAGLMANVVSLLLTTAYFGLMEGSAKRGTVGKTIMKLTVGDMEGKALDSQAAWIRAIVKVVCIVPCCLGMLVGFFTANKQGIHDMAAKSNVYGE